MKRILSTIGLVLVIAMPAWSSVSDGVVSYERGDFTEAYEILYPFAEQGRAVAQYFIGSMYANGQGRPQDHQEAARWYRLAADQGHATAQYNLGVLYRHGEGVSRDIVQAHMWFDLAAAQGNTPARINRDMIAETMLSEQLAESKELSRSRIHDGETPLATENLIEDVYPDRKWWYVHFGIGVTRVSYQNDLQSRVDRVADIPDASNAVLPLDLGFYFVRWDNWVDWNNQLITGLALTGNVDKHAFKLPEEWFQCNSYLFGPSTRMYFDQRVGRGFFLRADGGISWMHLYSANKDNEGPDIGIGLLLGVGYSYEFRLLRIMSLSFNGNYTIRHIKAHDGDYSNALTFTIGLML